MSNEPLVQPTGSRSRPKLSRFQLQVDRGMITQGVLQLTKSFTKALVVFAILGAPFTISIAAQNSQIHAPSVDNQRRERDDPLETMEAEMLAKRAIKEEEKQYRENLERARDLCALGTTIVSSFKKKNWLDEGDLKKLEKVEKLAKGIRRAAGGSEDEVEMENPPRDIASAMEMLETLSQSLKANVEKTPKHVISAAVIDKANVLLELIRILRTLPSALPSKA
ncbi:MAG TPA: hypothetical protein VGW76_19235 [Pyrinomonadaceae bacterium]|nr:hypothetical protein [Pyrinomonadaceae bacterium]